MRLLHLEIRDCLDCPYLDKLKTQKGTIYFCEANENKSSNKSFRDLFDECPLPNVGSGDGV